ncbi:class I SAM-dependent methyltransferase [Delftia tsuruhatensis]|uniref:class I SAM-dependent methyltransferase n=1 Tax=Delftia tsuruhatensis TaxID=180282 RepID=UPI0028A918D6|nr:methyltransferase domain-containing protein [Delftia tsuruhatensis]
MRKYQSLLSRARTHSQQPSRLRSDYILTKTLRNAIVHHIEKWNLLENERIVDFGCGSMPYATLIIPRCGEYLGCDLVGSGAALEFEPGGLVPVSGKSAARVVSFQVLEHVHDVSWYLGEAHRMLKDDGKLLLSTHGFWPYHPHPEDFWRWTRTGLIRDIERHGFEVQSIESLVGPGAWTLMFQFGSLSLALCKLGFPGRLAASGINLLCSFMLPLIELMTPHSLRQDNASVYLVSAKKKLPS